MNLDAWSLLLQFCLGYCSWLFCDQVHDSGKGDFRVQPGSWLWMVWCFDGEMYCTKFQVISSGLCWNSCLGLSGQFFLVLFVVLCGLILCEGGMFSVDFST